MLLKDLSTAHLYESTDPHLKQILQKRAKETNHDYAILPQCINITVICGHPIALNSLKCYRTIDRKRRQRESRGKEKEQRLSSVIRVK
jgi:hypothetical protein